MGSATDYSNELIKAFEDSLPIAWDGDTPIMIPDRLDINHIQAFQNTYRDCHAGSIRDGAITDLHSYSDSNSLLQTSGVGLAEDFNQFVNLGMLTGNRVVLWDTVILGTFFPSDGKLDRNEICKRTCEILTLKKVISAGGIIMLPHPWNMAGTMPALHCSSFEYTEPHSIFFRFPQCKGLKGRRIFPTPVYSI